MTREEQLDLNAARSAARQSGMFIAEKAGKWLLIRLSKPRNVVVGSRRKVSDLRRLVLAAAATQATAILTTQTRSESRHDTDHA